MSLFGQYTGGLQLHQLKLRREQQEADRGRADGAWIDTGLVFTTRHGTALEQGTSAAASMAA